MRVWNYEQLAKEIDTKKSLVEQKILNDLCIMKWKDAEDRGKIKYITKNEWYYEY